MKIALLCLAMSATACAMNAPAEADSADGGPPIDDSFDDSAVVASKSAQLWRELERHASVVLGEYYIAPAGARYRVVAVFETADDPSAIEWNDAATLEAALEATVAGVRRELELGPFLAAEDDIPSALDKAMAFLESGCWSIRLQFHSQSELAYQASLKIGAEPKSEGSVMATVQGATFAEALDAAVARLTSARR